MPQEGRDRKVQVLREAKEGFSDSQGKERDAGAGADWEVFILGVDAIFSALFPLMTMSYFKGNSTSASIVEVVFSVGLLFGSLILSKWEEQETGFIPIVGSLPVNEF